MIDFLSDFFDSLTLEDVSRTAQIAGTVMSGIGAYQSARGQQSAVRTQSALDLITARSEYNAGMASIDLQSINNRMAFAAESHAADMAVISARMSGADDLAQAEIAMARASASAAQSLAGAAIDENEARLAELRAQSALYTGEAREQQARMEGATVESGMRARYAGRNIDVGVGTAAASVIGRRVMTEQQVSSIRHDALMAVIGARISAENAMMSASAKRAAAGSTMSIAGMQQSLAESRSAASVSMALANADYQRAAANAGLLNAEAAAEVRRSTLRGNLANAEAGSASRLAISDAVSPFTAGLAAALSGATRVAETWYRADRATNGTRSR